MTADVELLPCTECGMPCRAGEYHPFAACLMFKACHNSETVRANLEALRAEVERLRADLMESDEIREKLGHLLTRTAAALKGEPPAGVWHSWHDLPERAERLAKALREWWSAHRPVGWTEDQHRARPYVNLITVADKALTEALLRDQEARND